MIALTETLDNRQRSVYVTGTHLQGRTMTATARVRVQETRRDRFVSAVAHRAIALGQPTRDGVLTVVGKREDGAEKTAYLHQGIAGRAFERSFRLAEHVEVKNATLENGLLHVELERQVPEEKKPRRITINAPELTAIQGSKAA